MLLVNYTMRSFVFRFLNGALVIISLILSCTPAMHIVKCNDSLIAIDSVQQADSAMSAEIVPYKTRVDKIMSEVLAYSDQVLKNNQPEGLLGDFIADLVLKTAKELCADSCSADICVFSNASFRNPLPKGNITRENVFQLMPYENEIVVLIMNGRDVNEMLSFIANKGGVPVAGFRMKIKNKMANEVMISDKPFAENRTYAIVTSDYLANGGDNMFFFSKAVKKFDLGIKLRDAIVGHLISETKNGNSINVKADGRIQVIQ